MEIPKILVTKKNLDIKHLDTKNLDIKKKQYIKKFEYIKIWTLKKCG